MTSIEFVIIESTDTAATKRLCAEAFEVDARVRPRSSEAATSGFRGFTLSVVVAQPADVDALMDAATDAGAEALKPAKRSLWGYGGVVQGLDGAIWTIASRQKKSTWPATKHVDELVLQLGVSDVSASKQFYVDQGFAVEKSYGGRYVLFGAESSPVKLALYRRRSLAKLAGVSPDGSGSHRLAIGSDAGPFTDPDGFVWE